MYFKKDEYRPITKEMLKNAEEMISELIPRRE